ncbi:hypothetical protein BKA64DRAFT_185326 [Cadophora sp. MPI-SDFR-AT-0126]|nr:hypothetical protein BKA64DRAFT_185326 [Leotiomycetes sp. MPI-SDFR-AT-0126]
MRTHRIGCFNLVVICVFYLYSINSRSSGGVWALGYDPHVLLLGSASEGELAAVGQQSEWTIFSRCLSLSLEDFWHYRKHLPRKRRTPPHARQPHPPLLGRSQHFCSLVQRYIMWERNANRDKVQNGMNEDRNLNYVTMTTDEGEL